MNLFQTTANVGNNSFQDPLNPFNTTQGSWGIDPTYLTPSYAAPYRPQYQGPQGAPPPDNNVGYGTSLYNVFTPFGQSRMYGDTERQDSPYYSALAYKPIDNAAWALQRGIVPALAFAAGMRASASKVRSNSAAYTSTMHAWKMATGMAPSMAASSAAKMGIGARVGSSIGQGLSRGLTGGLGAMGVNVGARAAGGLAGSAGLIGAGVGSIAAPLLIGQGLSTLADEAIFDPYSATRAGEQSLRANFGNIMAGTGSNGGVVSGFGSSRQFASGLSSRLTRSSIKDMSLDTYGMNDLTDMAARSGQLDDVQLEQLESRMKKLAKQVKVMMRVANEPDFRAAMEMMAELKVAGVSANTAGRVLQNIGGSSAVAGISAQKMMNTVGAQGQYIYQSNNLTPYIGQTQAAQTYGAFSSAYRMGLIGDATMAKFGGREGITQLAVTGQVNAAQTPYNQIMLMNQTFGRGNQGSVVGNLSSFGQMAAADPLAAAGAMGMYEGEMTSKQLMEKGPGAILDQLKQISGSIPGMQNRDGQIDVEKAFLLMTRQMGLPEMEAKAVLKELQVYGKQGARDQMTAALQGNMKRDTIKFLEQEGMGSGVLNKAILPVKNAWKSIKAGGASLVGDILEGTGGAGDGLEGWINNARFGSLTEGLESKTLMEFSGGDDPSTKSYQLEAAASETGKKWLARFPATWGAQLALKTYTGKDLIENNIEAIDTINRLVKSGDKNARVASDPNATPEQRKKALDSLNAENKLDRFLSSSELDSLSNQVLNSGTTAIEDKGPITKADKVRKGITDSIGKDVDMMRGISILEAARKVSTGQGDDSSEALLREVYGKDLNRTQLREKSIDVYKASAMNGVAQLPSMMNGKSSQDLERAARAGSTGEFGPNAPELKAEIKRIESSSLSPEEKKKKISEAIAFYRSKATGIGFSATYDPKILSEGNLSVDTIDKGLESSRELSKQTLQINSLASQGVINFDTKYSSLAALDLTKAVDTFGEFVAKLDGVADKFERASGNGPGLASKAMDWLSGGNQKSESTGNK